MQLTERRRGNEFYQSGNWNAAKYHYDRAKAIVDFVRGQGPDEQAEIDANRVAVLLNLAAVSLATREYCSAVELCSEALASDCGNQKALLRRAKAHVASHNYTVRMSAPILRLSALILLLVAAIRPRAGS